MHTVVFNYVLPGMFSWLAEKNAVLLVLVIVVSAFAIFIVCAVIEFVRIRIFKVCRINVFLKWLEKKISI